MRLVMLHGRDQQGQNPNDLKSIWYKSLDTGLQKNNLTLPNDIDIVFPFYGDILEELVNQSKISGDIEGVIARGDIPQHQLIFYNELLLELIKNAAIPQSAIEENYTGAYIERGPLNWGWTHALLQTLDKHTSIGNLSIKKYTYDVFVYLTFPGIRSHIDNFVINEIGHGPFVLVGHSLGSVIGYNILHSGKFNDVRKYITLGSPLGLKAIKTWLKKPLSMPTCIKDGWYNAYDDADVVALNSLDKNNFNINPPIENNNKIYNWTDNRHGIEGYLDDKNVALAIHSALLENKE